MWDFNSLGFYSAVQDKHDSRVIQVRSRSKEDSLKLASWLVSNDLVQLDEQYPTVESMVLEWKGRDYPARVLVWREHWAAFVHEMAMQIDYTNFKDSVKKKQGQRRASIYGRVWGVLLDITREHQPAPKKAEPRAYELPFTSSRLWDDLHEEFPGLVSSMTGTLSDTDERCPRCDKFLSDVGVDSEGECKVCKGALDEAIEREDWTAVEQISTELDLL